MLAGKGKLLSMLLLAGMVLAAARPVAAQQYLSLDPSITSKAAKSIYRKVDQALRNPSALSANQSAINEYYQKYFFPMMTSTSPEGLGQLAKLRDSLFRRTLVGANSKPAQDYITKLVLSGMQKIAQGRFHPAVRYNAVLILGELDQQYAGKGTGSKPPVPLPEGTLALLGILENKDKAVPPMLVVAALIGLDRHARLGIDPKYKQQVTQAAIGHIQQQEQLADLDSAVADWIKCLAGQVLARQYAAGPNAQVNQALLSLIQDQEMSLADRCHVASMLEGINYAAATGVDTTPIVEALGKLAQKVTHDEASLARKFKAEMLRGNMGNFQRGGFRASRTGNQTIGPRYERRRLLDRLISLNLGMESLKKASNPEAKERLTALAAPLQPVIELAKDKNQTEVHLADPVISLAGEVERIVRSWTPVEAEEAAVPEAAKAEEKS